MNTKHTEIHNKRINAKRISKTLFATGFCLFLTAGAFAQPGGGDDDPDTPVPFDGGITLLVAAGTAYGIKQWKQSRNENKDSDIIE